MHLPTCSLLLSLPLLLPCVSSAAQAPLAPAARPVGAAARLLVDRDAETGTLWVLGAGYKLSLDASGARFRVPSADRAAVRTLALAPVEARAGDTVLDLAAAPLPERVGDGARFARGALEERWQFHPGGVRQSFLLLQPPPAGDLVLRIAVGGDLEHEPDGGELRFASADGARVAYGDWLAIDAQGRQSAGRPRLVDGAIEIDVPAAFLAAAAYPLLIDPVIASAVLHATTHDIHSHDVAVDESLGALLQVHQETFAAGDDDVIARRYTTAGAFLGETAIDISDAASETPAVANHEAANQFLVAWTDFPDGPYEVAQIRGRTHAAGSSALGSSFAIKTGDFAGFPDVGGPSSSSTVAPYYVVWHELSGFFSPHGDVSGRTVTPSGATGPKARLDSRSSDQSPPRISKRSGPGGRWMVVYTTELANGVASVDAAFVQHTGAVLHEEVSLTHGVVAQPDVDGDGTQFLTVFQSADGAGFGDIHGVRTTFGSALSHVAINLSSKELPLAQLILHQVQPTVARHGDGFTYAYMEAATTTTSAFRVFAATLTASTSPVTFTEKRVSLSPFSGAFVPRACNGLLDEPVFVAWLSPGNPDLLELAVYEPQ